MAGEAGIGKTRLATELASQAERDGAVVLAGRCDQHLGVPYLPLREAVGRHLASYPSERLRGLLGPRAAELVRFWPELAWRLPALPAPSAPGPAADPYLLLEALTGLLEAIAVSGPLLLLVDDLHGADEGSLLLLRSLAGARRPARLLTVLTYRDDERAPRATLTAALGDLVRAPGAELLTLDGLGADEVAAMAEAAAARPLGQGGQALAHVLRERTGGNPFLVGELLRHLAETGGLDGGDVTEAAAGPAVDDVPESVRWVVGQRLARLGGPVEHVLGVVAVIGQQAELALLRRVAGLGWDDLLAALDVAVAARLLEERPGPPGRYAFHHPIVRDLLYRRLPASERARAHRRVGEALEELTGGAGRLGELADHFALAGEPVRRPGGGLRPAVGRAGRRRPPLRGGGPPPPPGPGPAGAGRRGRGRPGAPGRAAVRPGRRLGRGRPGPPGHRRLPAGGGGRPLGRLGRRPGPGRPRAGRPDRLLVGRPRPVGPGRACSARPSTPPAPATARPGPSCWPAWPAGGRWDRAPARGRGARGRGARPRPGSPRRWPWPAGSATRGPWSRSWPTRRPPGTASCGRRGRRPPWPPRPSWTAWPPSWATTTWPGRRAGPGRAPCWPPATWTASTG